VTYEVQPAEPDDSGGCLSAFDRSRRWPGAIQSGLGLAGEFGGPLAIFNLSYLDPWLGSPMKFSLRDLFLVTMIVALAVGHGQFKRFNQESFSRDAS